VLHTKAESEEAAPDLCGRLPEELRRQVSLVTHDPDQAGRMAYLATSRHDEAIVLNRALVDADLVVPIGVLRPEGEPGYYDPQGGLYPTFGAQKAQQRFRSPNVMHAHGNRNVKLHDEVDEVAWLLGVTFGIQVVPGPGESILHVVAGAIGAIGSRGRELYDQAWSARVPSRASLVLATIEGGPDQQTWSNLGHALAAASRLVEEGGAIVLGCSLAGRPGPGVQGLSEVETPSEALPLIRKVRPVDLFTALQIAHALEQARIYLLSDLDSSLVEQLNMIVVETPDDLARLVRRHDSCMVLSNAPHAVVTVENES